MALKFEGDIYEGCRDEKDQFGMRRLVKKQRENELGRHEGDRKIKMSVAEPGANGSVRGLTLVSITVRWEKSGVYSVSHPTTVP